MVFIVPKKATREISGMEWRVIEHKGCFELHQSRGSICRVVTTMFRNRVYVVAESRHLSDVLKQYTYLTTKLDLSRPAFEEHDESGKKKWFKAHIIRMVLLGNDGMTQISKQINYVRDSQVDACFRCGAKFTMLRRRHHCVLCGNIFCNNCSPRVDFRDRRTKKIEIQQRTCERCLKSYSETSKIVASKFFVDTNVLIDSEKRQIIRKRSHTMEPVSVETCTSTTASIRWSAIQGDLYDLQVSPDTYFSSWEDLRILVDREGDIRDGTGTIGHYVIRGLEPGTRYVARIARAVGSDRHHQWSSQTRFRTATMTTSFNSRKREKKAAAEEKSTTRMMISSPNRSSSKRHMRSSPYKRSISMDATRSTATTTGKVNQEESKNQNDDDDGVVVSSKHNNDTVVCKENVLLSDIDDYDDIDVTALTLEERKIRNVIMISVVLGCAIQPAIEFVRSFLRLENPVLIVVFQNTAVLTLTVLVMIFTFFTLGLHRMCGCTTLRRRRDSPHPLDRLGIYKNRAFSESDNDSTTSEEKVKDDIEGKNHRRVSSSSMRTPVTTISAALRWRKRVRSSSHRIKRKRPWNSGMSSYAYVAHSSELLSPPLTSTHTHTQIRRGNDQLKTYRRIRCAPGQSVRKTSSSSLSGCAKTFTPRCLLLSQSRYMSDAVRDTSVSRSSSRASKRCERRTQDSIL